MQNSERNYQNEAALDRYEETVATKKDEEKKKEREDSPARSMVSFYLLVDERERDKKGAELSQVLLITKNLITYLYSDQRFYKEVAETRPDFVEEILSSLMRSTAEGALLRKPRIRLKKDLATVDLQDKELNDVFYRMLKGPPERGIEQEEKEKKPDIFGRDPYKPTEVYPSLLKFITMDKKDKIRVFLASPQLLMAIYGDPILVSEILMERYRLFREVDKDLEPMDKKDASNIFKSAFANRQMQGIADHVLDFSVTKSNPRANR